MPADLGLRGVYLLGRWSKGKKHLPRIGTIDPNRIARAVFEFEIDQGVAAEERVVLEAGRDLFARDGFQQSLEPLSIPVADLKMVEEEYGGVPTVRKFLACGDISIATGGKIRDNNELYRLIGFDPDAPLEG